jgi:predicted CoA-binding protein
MKKTLVLGASSNPLRFSYKAIKSLLRRDYPVVAVGRKTGLIDDVEIKTGFPKIHNVHTLMLYLSPDNQKEYYSYIIDLAPHRIIFNPGTENDELYEIAKTNKIDVVVDCGLVMINADTY